MDVDPMPDGVTTTFAVPDSRLLENTLTVTANGAAMVPASIDLERGRFVVSAPPAATVKLLASYYFQWFTDEELAEFLGQAVQIVGHDGVDDATLPVSLRPVVQSFGAYYAYMKKAAQSADTMSASVAGFMADTTKQHPYWMNLARMAWEQAQKELELVDSITPLSSNAPAMRFVSFRVPRYVPRS